MHKTDISVVERKKKIARLAGVVRKRHLALKLGKSEENETLKKTYESMMKPLRKLLRHLTFQTKKCKELMSSCKLKRSSKSIFR